MAILKSMSIGVRCLCLLSACFLLKAQAPPEIIASLSGTGGFQPRFQVAALTPQLTEKIAKTTWHSGCPVPPSDLLALTVSYWDFQAKPKAGVLIVNRGVAQDLKEIFQQLFRHGFLIERIDLIEDYGGDDEKSMEANNTSAFNCRDITLHPGKFSNHSWGRAVDINPRTNPYVKGSKFFPTNAAAYLDRNRTYLGGILADSFAVKLFQQHGWTWGGTWTDRKDYQHFEKPEPQRDRPAHK